MAKRITSVYLTDEALDNLAQLGNGTVSAAIELIATGAYVRAFKDTPLADQRYRQVAHAALTLTILLEQALTRDLSQRAARAKLTDLWAKLIKLPASHRVDSLLVRDFKFLVDDGWLTDEEFYARVKLDAIRREERDNNLNQSLRRGEAVLMLDDWWEAPEGETPDDTVEGEHQSHVAYREENGDDLDDGAAEQSRPDEEFAKVRVEGTFKQEENK